MKPNHTSLSFSRCVTPLLGALVLALGAGCQGNSTPTPVADLSVAPADAALSSVVVNEVFPHGTDDVTDPDWAELKNISAAAVDLSGYKVRDENTPVALPAGTVLRPGEYLVLYCDDNPDGGNAQVIHLPFKLGSKDEFVLIAPDGSKADGAAWAKDTIPTDKALGRLPDGTGQFTLVKPTKGARNGV